MAGLAEVAEDGFAVRRAAVGDLRFGGLLGGVLRGQQRGFAGIARVNGTDRSDALDGLFSGSGAVAAG